MTVLFSYAFRPLFLGATLYALLVVPYWALGWLGGYSMPSIIPNPLAWHGHEMIHGFAGAAIGGFALTAVATWTRRAPVAGAPLVVLGGLWLTARLLGAFGGIEIRALLAVTDVAFGVLLCLLMAREVIAARNRRNYKVLLLLALLPVTNALFYAGLALQAPWTMPALSAALWVVILLVNLVGGRVIPAFTGNWLARQTDTPESVPASRPPPFGSLDGLATWLLVGFAFVDVVGAPPWIVATLAAATSVTFVVRLARWKGFRSVREPLVLVLHVAFAWIPVAVALLGAAALGLLPRTAGVHALTTGAMTTMILAIASRAALGHTGRPLQSHPLVTASYVLVTLAAISRVAAAGGWGARPLLAASAAAWTVGFACFIWRYVPILLGPKVRSPRSLPTV